MNEQAKMAADCMLREITGHVKAYCKEAMEYLTYMQSLLDKADTANTTALADALGDCTADAFPTFLALDREIAEYSAVNYALQRMEE